MSVKMILLSTNQDDFIFLQDKEIFSKKIKEGFA